jgi:hypothetical protein
MELEKLNEVQYNYPKIQISILAKITALYWQKIGIHTLSYL